ALDIQTAGGPPGRILRAELLGELDEAVSQQQRTDEAELWWDQAARHYRAVLDLATEGKPDTGQIIAALWGLQTLYQKTGHSNHALDRAEADEREWGGVLGGPKLKFPLGTLQVLRDSSASPRPQMEAAVAEFERESPPNYVDLPRAYTTLAIVEQTAGNLDR